MKKLNEWVDANGNKITIPSGNSSTTSKKSAGYYQRLIRLLNYHIDHKDKDVDRIVTADVRNFGLDYIEHHKGQFEGGYFKKVTVRISDTEDWFFTVDLDNKQITNKVGKGWDKLVYELSFDLSLPQVTSDPEYQELLKEWVDKDGKKVNIGSSQTTNTNIPNQIDRYRTLVAQIRWDGLFDCEVNALTDTVLNMTLKNKVNTKVPVRVERLPYFPNYSLKIGNHRMSYDDYEDILKALMDEGIIATTDLCESLNEWVDSNGNKVSLNKTSTSPKTNKEKFEELVAYMKKYEVPYTAKTEVVNLNDMHFKYKVNRKSPGIKEYTITLDVHYSRFDSYWQFVVYRNGDYLDDASGKGWEELLLKLRSSEFGVVAFIPKPGSKEYDTLCEATSFAEDFKNYETMWN